MNVNKKFIVFSLTKKQKIAAILKRLNCSISYLYLTFLVYTFQLIYAIVCRFNTAFNRNCLDTSFSKWLKQETAANLKRIIDNIKTNNHYNNYTLYQFSAQLIKSLCHYYHGKLEKPAFI